MTGSRSGVILPGRETGPAAPETRPDPVVAQAVSAGHAGTTAAISGATTARRAGHVVTVPAIRAVRAAGVRGRVAPTSLAVPSEANGGSGTTGIGPTARELRASVAGGRAARKSAAGFVPKEHGVTVPRPGREAAATTPVVTGTTARGRGAISRNAATGNGATSGHRMGRVPGIHAVTASVAGGNSGDARIRGRVGKSDVSVRVVAPVGRSAVQGTLSTTTGPWNARAAQARTDRAAAVVRVPRAESIVGRLGPRNRICPTTCRRVIWIPPSGVIC